MTTSKFPWGGTTFTNILHLSGDEVPDSVSVSNETKVYGVGSYSAHTVVINQDYVLPFPFDIASVIDGTVSGAFKVSLYGSGGTESSMAAVSSIDVQLRAVDSDGNSRTLCDENVWSGNELALSGKTITIAAMYWFLLNEELREDERLVMNIKVTGYSGGYTGNVLAWIKLHHAKNTDELSITLPLVI
jgi:hypothetical protein